MITYAGIGARDTPPEILARMVKLGKFMAIQGAMLHSGGASGADAAFEEGCDYAQGFKRIYLPWEMFKNNGSEFFEPSREAFLIAQKYHPKWEFLLPHVRQLMARTSHVMLGPQCNSRVRFVACWTKGGEIVGGTGQALRIATDLNIPILNFASMSLESISEQVKDMLQ